MLAVAGGLLLTRHDWEAALNSNSGQQPSSGASVSTSSATPCPSDVAGTIPDGDGSKLIEADQTSGFYVTLCSTAAGDIYYYGADKTNSSQQITLPAERDGDTYTATNNGYEYQVTSQDLIVSQDGQTLLDQPLSPAS